MKRKGVLGLGVIIMILAIIFLFLNRIVNFAVNVEWFKEIGYSSVYFTKIIAVLKLMVPTFIICFLCIWFYYKSIRLSVMKYRKVIEVDSKKESFYKKITIFLDIIVSFLISYGFSTVYWYRILQFNNSVPFNIKDPILHLDISFYVFKLPLIQSIYNVILSLVVFLTILTFIVYIILNLNDNFVSTKGFRNQFNKINFKSGITRFAGRQLAVLSALIMLSISFGFFLKSVNLVYSNRGVTFGAGYTDIHVSFFLYRIICVVSVVAAVVIFTSIIKSKMKPIIISIVVIACLIITNNIAGTIVQNFVVKSNQKTLEQPYIKNNIDYTRKAFNIQNIDVKSFEVKDNLTINDVKDNMDTINNIRVNSYEPTLEFYNQVQIIRYYYNFNDADIDRYNIDGRLTQVFLGAREINSNSIDPDTWQNRHLIYTHGYGLVMNKVNSVTSDGQPNFVIKDMPPQNSTNIKIDNPRIYFGESTNDYAIVNTKLNEFDYPKGSDNATNKYKENSGINMNFFNKILFSLYQKNANFILSRDIDSNSKILINRNIKDRVKKIAPFLNYDSDPYVVISGGQLYWILDGYTASDKYPYSQPQSNGMNYIRNSFKVVVNALNGDTNFYIVDKNDPIAKSYSKIFPGLFKNLDTLSPDIRQHFKYPEDLFTIQSNVIGKYHVTDPGVFYNGEDVWEVAKNQKQVNGDKSSMESPYVVMKLPGEKKEEMMLIQYLNMRNKDNMSGLFGARMDGNNYGKMVLYKFPPEKTVYSPYLFKQRLNQDPNISQELSLWNKDGSKVQYGDTIILPIDNSLLYIEPVYLRASGKDSIPEMKRVIVSYGDKMILSQNIDTAMQELFNYNQNDNSQPDSNQKNNDDLDDSKSKMLQNIKNLYNKAMDAQKNGDWSKYGDYIKQLGENIDKLNK
ncbi:MAG: UPF0182 family protein [Clostridium tyrobutyricum]|jgi:uncharacterized membrane protein (UPF0182 family)|uniref:UPF0182 family protein n=1 Tax=Clostridium tyrobutyricum TaxID=1519 RepID=UPI00031015BC|nr:UPF0182 family protein [Clostridium tyrobutyricum]MBV4417153.1 UPF0182 family protein [Clostridium tyrobutyricum]MBV4423197.1 UPF0182 family protein [Clostridium tyrobutyricum]MCH4200858.1 UPF0182 family protein [Clostridium tyrobutyricum]MCH4260244.1 UPF0182 family protein [Clostridium tyrobutyricum]MCI1653539.1 UPF0182 family protein [Clostridium tyrobutyricum]